MRTAQRLQPRPLTDRADEVLAEHQHQRRRPLRIDATRGGIQAVREIDDEWIVWSVAVRGHQRRHVPPVRDDTRDAAPVVVYE